MSQDDSEGGRSRLQLISGAGPISSGRHSLGQVVAKKSRPIPKPIEPLLSRKSVNPTHHGLSKKVTKPSGHAVKSTTPTNPSTPSRIRFDQPSSSDNRLFAKKSSAGKSRPSLSSPSGEINKKSSNVKSYKPLLPLGEQLDNKYEEKMLSLKRDRSGTMAGFAKRTTQRRRDANVGEDDLRLDIRDPHVVAQIAPVLRLKVGGQDADSDDDRQRYRPQPKLTNVKVQNPPQRALKAARKFQSIDASSSESESESDESDSETTDSSSSDGTVNQQDLLNQDRDGSDPRDPEDVAMEDAEQNSYDNPIVLDETAMITAPLPGIDDVKPVGDMVDTEPSIEPPADLIRNMEALSLSTIRLRKYNRLPFLRRNLRQGLYGRCRSLLVPIYSDDKEIRLEITYEVAGGTSYLVEVNKWMCPICDLFGASETREILDCHLQWDHQEVYYTWEDLDSREVHFWRLQLVIQEPDLVTLPSRSPELELPEAPEARDATIPPGDLNVKVRQRSETPNISAIFPSVSLSPPSGRLAPRLRSPGNVQVKREEIEASLEPQAPPISTTVSQRSTTSRSTSAAGPSTGSNSRSLSLTGASETPSTSTATRRLRSPSQRYVTPPPQSNPLGPAAQPPYLPADYGGNLVLYSCRPGGPCLFDLLGTLPMEPFGLVDWEVLDREDEIYESDDVKEEYKIMHALWARWIILNRNKFIANYAKGVIAFIEEYWKMIHWAAGWDALRYFLFIFLANQFLTGQEVAQTLTHYETLTGMASWYD